ncbi:MAG: hypothetical protein A3J80_10130 [Desulfobacula sp. RIFOXYB2_FULL_45_6]|nr:MAG: hypothetical protein A3J80_10130 [Desulfobacula sp. RIFOXYB2_FULL_45_6]
MDKKTAFEILNLDDAATLADAKKAYRILAKRYHPDVMDKKSFAERDVESKMKEINLAFRYIAPLLKLNEAVKIDLNPIFEDGPPVGRSHNARKAGWGGIVFKKFKEFLIRVLFLNAAPGVLINQKRKSYPKQKLKQSKNPFRDVLKKVCEKPLDHEKIKSAAPKKKNLSKRYTFINYHQKYIGLKQTMKSGRFGENYDISIGRVSKIEPVSRIRPINED